MKVKASNTQSLIVLSIILLVIIILKIHSPEKYSFLKFTTGQGATSLNFSNRWQYKFHYLDGCVTGAFTAKNDHSKIIYSSNIEEGTIVYNLYDRSNNLIYTFPVDNTIDSLKGVFEKGERYEVRATAKNAKGNFDFTMQ